MMEDNESKYIILLNFMRGVTDRTNFFALFKTTAHALTNAFHWSGLDSV